MARSVGLIRARVAALIEGLTPDSSPPGASRRFTEADDVLSLAAQGGGAIDRRFDVRVRRGRRSDLLTEPSLSEWVGTVEITMIHQPALGRLQDTRDRAGEDAELIASTLAQADPSGLHGWSSGTTSVQSAWPGDVAHEDDVAAGTGEPLFAVRIEMQIIHREDRA